MKEIAVDVYKKHTVIYDPTEDSECDNCGQEVATIELREARTYNPLYVCPSCLLVAINKAKGD